MVEKIKSVQPKTGKTHRFFGSRFLKLHNIRDPKWTTKDKFTQYQGLTLLHEKDQKLAVLAGIAEMKKRLRRSKVLRQDIKDDRESLKLAIFGDTIRTQNILQNHKNLQRLYQSMPNHLIVDNMDQRTFVKRKELDRLICQKNKLTQKYEYELLEFSRLQDRIKYMDVLQLTDNTIAKKIRMDLKNSETRMKAIKTINRAYQRIITSMMQDSLYFEPVLGALEEDIEEQQSFIATSIRLGRPALANLDKLSKDYERLQEQTQRDIKPRLETLKEYRNQIEKNNATIKELVRRDSDFVIFPKRYERQTSSMTQLKTHLEEVEKVMKQVKAITSCDRASQVYPRVKRQFKENIRMEGNVIPKERERNAANERDIHAQVQREALNHNLTTEEIQRLDQMESLRSNILDEERLQTNLNKDITERNMLLSKLKLSFQHTLDVLRHVGDKHRTNRTYANDDLNLPLLKFTAFVTRARPPSPFEENVDTVVDLLKQRVNVLMNVYDEEKFAKEREQGIKVFHDAVLQDMHSEEVKAMENMLDPNIVNRLPNEDPSVLSRLRLKAISNRIVEQNTKKDDFGKKK